MDRPTSLLLVEDERTLRGLVAQFLRASGHRVVEAADGEEGWARYEDSGPFGLVLTDLMMPVLCGVELCGRILRACPGQRVAVCSAAIEAEQESVLRRLGVRQFLTKPYHPEALLRLIAAEAAPAAPRATPAHPRCAPGPHRPGPLALVADRAAGQ